MSAPSLPTDPIPTELPTTQQAMGRIERAHAWVLEHWPTTLRRRLALIAVLVGACFVVIAAAARLLGTAIELGLLAYLGLMLVCWVGAGGALVPVPGVRPLSWVMIVQQSSSLEPWLVCVLSAVAMGLGQTSYFIATRVGERHHPHVRGHLHHTTAGGNPTDLPAAGEPEAAAPVGGVAAPRPWDGITRRSRALLAQARDLVARRMRTHPKRIVFLLSMVPNPLTTFATVTAAAVGMSFGRFFVAATAGFLVLCAVLVVGGQTILHALGLSG